MKCSRLPSSTHPPLPPQSEAAFPAPVWSAFEMPIPHFLDASVGGQTCAPHTPLGISMPRMQWRIPEMLPENILPNIRYVNIKAKILYVFCTFAYPLLSFTTTEPHGLLTLFSCFLLGLGTICDSDSKDLHDLEFFCSKSNPGALREWEVGFWPLMVTNGR